MNTYHLISTFYGQFQGGIVCDLPLKVDVAFSTKLGWWSDPVCPLLAMWVSVCSNVASDALPTGFGANLTNIVLPQKGKARGKVYQ